MGLTWQCVAWQRRRYRPESEGKITGMKKSSLGSSRKGVLSGKVGWLQLQAVDGVDGLRSPRLLCSPIATQGRSHKYSAGHKPVMGRKAAPDVSI